MDVRVVPSAAAGAALAVDVPPIADGAPTRTPRGVSVIGPMRMPRSPSVVEVVVAGASSSAACVAVSGVAGRTEVSRPVGVSVAARGVAMPTVALCVALSYL
jgi:hypothetical protein